MRQFGWNRERTLVPLWDGSFLFSIMEHLEGDKDG